ncbi:PD-(D/E)XK nuclease family protein [Parapedobacter koreensis]|uniref:PD-(D/E)XK nuclease superfamily protein n=1 Tax=Parapedobacter koreensis TaxID=332977 RepID=A0A1H7SPS7_9SPHI|nr:PD-(D/E)XK nuclease family protein [Parapedobacter koreensis]SEL74458.1 PD-(D/E)XK nuclease superfamily protein [Parapedobacter koreensis]
MPPFLRQVAADLLSRFDDDLKDVAVVLTNKRPIVFLRKHLADLAGKPLWSPSFFTIQEFLRQSTTIPEASSLMQFFILHQLHNALLREEGRPEETPDEFYPLAETILSDFAQLDYDLAAPEDVYAELRDIALLQQRFPHLSAEQQRFMRQFWESFSVGKQTAIQQKFLQLWGRLPTLYRRFKDELIRQGLATTAGIYRDLVEGRATNPDFMVAYKQVAFIGFNALNRCEVRLFVQWQEVGKALFYFDADSYYLDDDLQEAGLFLRKNIRQYGLKQALGDVPALLAAKTGPIDIRATSGKVAQAKLLATLIADRPADRDAPTSTAIILADESLLIPVLQSLPEGIDFNVTMGYPLIQSTLFGFVDLWLGVQQQLAANQGRTVHHLDVEAVLTHPLSGVLVDERDALQKKMVANEWLEVPASELQFETGSYPAFFVPQTSNDALLQALHILLDGVLRQRQETHSLRHIEAVLILAVKKALNLLQEGLAHYSELSLPFLCALIRKALQSISAPIEGEPLKGIQVMGLLESRCLDFDEVYLIGANEGTLPNITAAPTFIPDSIRRANGLPVLENQDALSAYLFYRLLQHPRHITVVYNAVVDDNNSGEVSRFIRQLTFESRFTFVRRSQQQPIKTIPAPSALSVPKTGAVGHKLSRYLNDTNTDRPKLSASALTTYLQSPLLFFLKYIAGIKEPPRVAEEFEMNRLGSVVHQAMQDTYEQLKAESDTITASAIHRKIKTLPQICLQALSKELYGEAGRIQAPNSMQRILLKVAEEYAAVFLHYDATHVAPLRIVELENERDYSVEFPITVQGELRTVKLYGIIDRVDEVNDKTRIVDYKTGRDEVKFQGLDTLFAPASAKSNKAMIQTLFYTYVYEQVTGKRGVEPNLYIARKLRKEGSLFYMGGRGGNFLAEGAALEDIKDQFVAFLRRTLEELFDPDVPFRHNPDAVLYPNDPYREFIGQEMLDNDES